MCVSVGMWVLEGSSCWGADEQFFTELSAIVRSSPLSAVGFAINLVPWRKNAIHTHFWVWQNTLMFIECDLNLQGAEPLYKLQKHHACWRNALIYLFPSFSSVLIIRFRSDTRCWGDSREKLHPSSLWSEFMLRIKWRQNPDGIHCKLFYGEEIYMYGNAILCELHFKQSED